MSKTVTIDGFLCVESQGLRAATRGEDSASFQTEGETKGELMCFGKLTPRVWQWLTRREFTAGLDRAVAVLPELLKEREYQEGLMKAGKFLWTCASLERRVPEDYVSRLGENLSVTHPERMTVLSEEFGEVGKEVTELIILSDRANLDMLPIGESEDKLRQGIVEKLRKELIQTAAVCVAWVEAIDAESEP